MVRTNFIQSVLYSSIATVIVLALINISSAQVRTSNNYQLQSDSINVGGGFSSSTNYVQESTVGEIATGDSDSASYSLRAGYQQMQEVFLSLSTTGDVVMDTAIGGLTGGESNGSTTFTVTTDSPSGYQLTIEAENDPAMQKGADSIGDYDPGATPAYAFLVAAADARFGYSVDGVDTAQRFLSATGVCDTGTYSSPTTCWDGLSTTPFEIAEGVGSNHPSGATTTVYFQVKVESGAGVIAGVYTATSTVTALPL